MIEEWKKIEGYEDYEVSNFGRIKSYKQDKNGKITLGNKDKKGYLTKMLYNKDGCKTFKVHRLVAQAFIPNPNNLPQINHKDENKTNNNVSNLEWCDNNYNSHYGTKIERAAVSNYCCETTSKKVYSVDNNGIIENFDSIGEAERITGLPHSNIIRALKGRRPTCGGRKWFYKE